MANYDADDTMHETFVQMERDGLIEKIPGKFRPNPHTGLLEPAYRLTEEGESLYDEFETNEMTMQEVIDEMVADGDLETVPGVMGLNPHTGKMEPAYRLTAQGKIQAELDKIERNARPTGYCDACDAVCTHPACWPIDLTQWSFLATGEVVCPVCARNKEDQA